MANQSFMQNLPEAAPPGRDYDLAHPVDDFLPMSRSIVTQPSAFFAALPRVGGYAAPLVFALVCAEISAALGGIIGLLGGGSVGGYVSSLIAAPIGAAIGVFVVAAIAQLLVHIVVGPMNSGYAATFRVAAYAAVVDVVSWIPIVGPLLGLYGMYLAIVGVREMHHTTTGKAALVVLIPVAIVVVLAFLVAVVAGLAFLGAIR